MRETEEGEQRAGQEGAPDRKDAVPAERLRRAQRMEILARLAGGVAHDFNNVLTVITSHAALLQNLPGAPPELRESIAEIATAARRGAALTRQLLLFEHGEPTSPRVVSLNATVADLEKLIGRTVGEDVEVSLALSSDPCPVLMDPGQLEQVLLSLVLNARDAMPAGGKLAIATAALGAGPGEPAARGSVRTCVLAVSGAGAAPAARPRLLEPLALSTIQGIARQAGGEILASSEAGEGSVFRLRLPRAERAGSGTRSAGAGRRVLVVEDDEVVRRMARRILEGAGHEVLEASNGTEACALSDGDAGPIDLLLADVVLPRMNGFLVAERLRVTRPALRVVYMSGFGEAVIARHKPAKERILLLRKPFGPEELTSRVEEALAAPRAPGP